MWVFILAGQSNMAGRDLVEAKDTISSNRIFSINKEGEIIIAQEPLHFYEPSLTGLDCGLSFGKELLKAIPDSINILLIPTAVGSTSISEWLGDSTVRNVKLLTNFKNKIELAKKYGEIKGILWHQGENDEGAKDIPYYKERLSQLLVNFRSITNNNNLPVLLGLLGSYSINHEDWQKINEQISAYSLTDKNTSIVKTADLKDKGDKVHFNSEAIRIIGKRYAEEYLKLIK